MCMQCQMNGSGVLVKLGDLGVSAFVGPGGFHRKPATPGHTAPEAIEYHGQYPIGEKVSYQLAIHLCKKLHICNKHCCQWYMNKSCGIRLR